MIAPMPVALAAGSKIRLGHALRLLRDGLNTVTL